MRMSRSSKYQHLNHASLSKRLYDELKPTRHTFWTVIVAFYMAVHVVDALLSEKNKFPRNHKHRWRLMNIHLKNLKDDYKILDNLAWDARYVATACLTTKSTELTIVSDILDQTFIPLLKTHGSREGLQVR